MQSARWHAPTCAVASRPPLSAAWTKVPQAAASAPRTVMAPAWQSWSWLYEQPSTLHVLTRGRAVGTATSGGEERSGLTMALPAGPVQHGKAHLTCARQVGCPS